MFGVALTMASDSVVRTITTVEFQRISFPSKRNLTPIKAVTLILSMFLKVELGGPSLVVQWLSAHLTVWGTLVPPLVWALRPCVLPGN